MATAANEQGSRAVTLLDNTSTGPLKREVHESPNAAGDRLLQSLSRTLDIEGLLNIFFEQLPVAHDGYHYSHELLEIDLQRGAQVGSRAEYRLVMAHEQLGFLSILRGAPFAFTELVAIEERLCALIYPLRNALLYRTALKSAFRDPLTGVDNRAALQDRLPREIHLARRQSTPASLLVLDVDRFKAINDTHGHHVGDTVLQRLVAVFQSVLRTADMICRYGGDEFVIVLNSTAADGAIHAAERIRQRVERTSVNVGNVRLVLSISVGVTELRADDDAHTLFQRADRALLQAKRSGRNRVALV